VRKKGERVGAIWSAKEGVVLFFGYGVYVGDEVPPKEVNEIFNEIGLPNPKIELDNGKVVYGIECWWGSEEAIKKRLKEFQIVVHTDIDEARLDRKFETESIQMEASGDLASNPAIKDER